MTDAGWVTTVLDESWDPSRDPVEGEGVIRDPVGTPNVTTEGGKGDGKARSRQLDTGDAIFVKDGGDPIIDPASVGYREEYIESLVSMEVVVSGGRADLVGRVDEYYGGVVGEVKRIVDEYRKGIPASAPFGDPGYTVLTVDNYADEVAKRGAGLWTGEWTIVFIDHARGIMQPAARQP